MPPSEAPREPQRRSQREAADVRDAADETVVVRDAVATYAERWAETDAATGRFLELVTGLLDEAGINYLSVTGRTKSVESFAGKAARTRDGRLLHPDPLTDITDQIGLRVITYVHGDVSAVADLLGDELAVLDDRDLGQETASEGRWGYASRHLLVSVDASRTVPPSLESLRRRSASVQVRTVLQHAWAEFEHDIRYKGSVPAEHAPDLDRRFTLAAGLLELADREFSAIRDRLQEVAPEPRPAPDEDPRIAATDLATFLAGRYTDAGWSRTDHYAWVSGLLLELGITSLDELARALDDVDEASVRQQMGYTYPPGAVRRLDDTLLAAYGERYVGLTGNAHRQAALEGRLAKLR